jgi:hypothetical protein
MFNIFINTFLTIKFINILFTLVICTLSTRSTWFSILFFFYIRAKILFCYFLIKIIVLLVNLKLIFALFFISIKRFVFTFILNYPISFKTIIKLKTKAITSEKILASLPVIQYKTNYLFVQCGAHILENKFALYYILRVTGPDSKGSITIIIGFLVNFFDLLHE